MVSLVEGLVLMTRDYKIKPEECGILPENQKRGSISNSSGQMHITQKSIYGTQQPRQVLIQKMYQQ